MTKSTKPNILVIWGDDIGIWNLSCYHRGMMGGRTPNIDRIAAEGALFTDYYGQQSCTAGRAAFITGQHPFRTGLLKVGLPGAELGLRPEDPTIADLLKNHGYMTGQFGKNHLGDRNEYLPTVHGFDEFFGNLYHLNAEEEPEDPQYPKDPKFKQRFGPRGALRCKATDVDDPTVDPRFGRVGKQTIEDTGPITRKRMETVDEEFLAGSTGFHGTRRQGGQAVLRLAQLDPHARVDAAGPEVREQHGLRPLRRRHEAARRHRRRAARQARRTRRRRKHDRGVLDRQRRREVHLARRRHVAVPRREGRHLGRRLPRSVRRPLAGRRQARHGHQRTRSRSRTGR